MVVNNIVFKSRCVAQQSYNTNTFFNVVKHAVLLLLQAFIHLLATYRKFSNKRHRRLFEYRPRIPRGFCWRIPANVHCL